MAKRKLKLPIWNDILPCVLKPIVTLKQDNEAKIIHELGTAGVANYAGYLGSMPSKYYHQGEFEGVDNVSGSKMAESILVGFSACQGCVIACGRVVNLGDGKKRKGPEYETVVGFGPSLLIDDLNEVVRLGEMCDKYGMDTISTANTIGLAFHLYEMGKVTKQDTGGHRIELGRPYGCSAIDRPDRPPRGNR